MRNKVSKRSLGYTLLALLLMAMIALPITMLMPSFGKFTESSGGNVGVTSTTGTKITDEKQLKAWLMGVQSHDGTESNNYLQKGEPIDNLTLYHDAYLADTFSFTNNANFQLKSDRILTGNGHTITLIADPDRGLNSASIDQESYNDEKISVEANGSTNSIGQRSGDIESYNYQGIDNRRFYYGVFLNHIEIGSQITDVNFIYTGHTQYNYDGWRRTFNMGVVVGRNEGTVNNISLDMRGYLQFEGKSDQPQTYLSIGGIAGFNGGVISNTDITFSEGGGIQSYTPMKEDDREDISRAYAAGIAGFNLNTITNVMVTYKDETFATDGTDGNVRAIYAETDGQESYWTGDAYAETFAGSITGRNIGKINSAVVNVEKTVGSINNLVESITGGGEEYDGMFAGYNDGEYSGLITNLNLSGMHGIHQTSDCYDVVHGTNIAYNRQDSDFITLNLAEDALENAIIWKVNGANVYERLTQSYTFDKTTLVNRITESTVGKNLAVAPEEIVGKQTFDYGDPHDFEWSDVFGTFNTYNEASIQLTDVYVKDTTEYVFDNRSRIDAGVYSHRLKQRVPGSSIAYLDDSNKILVHSSEIKDFMIREDLEVKQMVIKLKWEGEKDSFNYDGSNQISKVKASFASLDGGTINADLTSIIADSGGTEDQGFKDAGTYTITASFESSNYKTASVETKTITMNKISYGIGSRLSLEPYSGEYDGKAHSAELRLDNVPGSTVEDILAIFVGADQIPLTATWTNESRSDVGTVDVTFNLQSNNPNYNDLVFEELTSTITIRQKEVDVKWDGLDTRKYDGTDHFNSIRATYSDVNKVLREFDIKVDTIDGEFRNYKAGGNVFTASLLNENYKIISSASITKTFFITTISIDKATLVWPIDKNYDYNGESIKPRLTNIDDVFVDYIITPVEEEPAGYTGSTEPFEAVNVGTYMVRATIEDDVNIIMENELLAETFTFDIEAIEYDFSRVVFGNKQYPFKNSDYVIVVNPNLMPKGKDGSQPIAEYGNNVFKDVTKDGGGEATVSFTSDSKNYTIPSNIKQYTAIISIVPAEVLVTWEGRDFTYDNIDHQEAIKASYMMHSVEPDGDLIKTDAEVSISNDLFFKDYKEGGYVFIATLNENYIAIIDASNTNVAGNSFATYHINRVALTIDKTKIFSSSTKDSITISKADDVIGVVAAAINDEGFQTGVLEGLDPITEYTVRVKLIADASLSTNYGESDEILITVSTKYSLEDYDACSSAIIDITIDSRAELELLMSIYNSLSEVDKETKKENFDVHANEFNAIINGINVAVDDNKKVAADNNEALVNEVIEEEAPPVEEAAAALAATLGLVALAGVAFKKVGGAL